MIIPKFKVGDKIKAKNEYKKYITDGYVSTITSIKDGRYWAGIRAIEYINEQDDWELVPNKFDISTEMIEEVVITNDTEIIPLEKAANWVKNAFINTFGEGLAENIKQEFIKAMKK